MIHPTKATGKQLLIYICNKRVHFIPTKFINDSAKNAGQSDGIWNRKLEDQTAVWEYV